MAEPITVEFDLEPDAVAELIRMPKKTRARYFAVGGLLAILGIADLFVGPVFIAPIPILVGGAILYGALQSPKLLTTTSQQLSGPTKIVFSSQGVNFSGAHTSQRLGWGDVRRTTELSNRWSLFNATVPRVIVVPKSAVPADQHEQVSSQLAQWGGSKYKRRMK